MPPIQIPSNTITLQHPTNGKIFNFEMIQVEGGSFKMGGTKYSFEKPIHEVHIPTFHIGKYPVTQALYEFVMGENPSYFEGTERPVEQVSWDDAKVFIEKLNKDYGNMGFRLLSEAEWEYAARGGKEGIKDNFEYSGSNEIEEVAWYRKNSHQETKPVGWKEPNQLGIYDMSGNVWEWCEDDWHSNYEDAPKDGSAWIDEPRASMRVYRGGSWSYNFTGTLRVAYRFNFAPVNRDYYLGFRLGLP
ncbi:MAG: formylglycine-generating enzyme family protein [Chitinophagales bacterium]